MASVDQALFVQTLSTAECLAHGIAEALAKYSDLPEPQTEHQELAAYWQEALEGITKSMDRCRPDFLPVAAEAEQTGPNAGGQL